MCLFCHLQGLTFAAGWSALCVECLEQAPPGLAATLQVGWERLQLAIFLPFGTSPFTSPDRLKCMISSISPHTQGLMTSVYYGVGFGLGGLQGGLLLQVSAGHMLPQVS